MGRGRSGGVGSWHAPGRTLMPRNGRGQVHGERSPHAKLTVRAVVALRTRPPRHLTAWAARHGVAVNTASQALHGGTWRHLNPVAPPRPVDRSAVGRWAQSHRSYSNDQ